MREEKNRNKILKAGKQITWQDQKNRILSWQQRMPMTIPIFIMWMCAQSPSHVRLFATQAPLPPRFLCPWDSPDKSARVGCHFPLQESFSTQGLNPWLRFPALAGEFFTTSATWEALQFISQNLSKGWGIDGSRSLRKWRKRLKYGWVLKAMLRSNWIPVFYPHPDTSWPGNGQVMAKLQAPTDQKLLPWRESIQGFSGTAERLAQQVTLKTGGSRACAHSGCALTPRQENWRVSLTGKG